MRLNLVDELLLLVYDDAGSSRASSQSVEPGLAGALLMELTLAGRLEIRDKRVIVSDARPVGDEIVDDALTRIGAERRRRKPKDWIGPLSRRLRARGLDRLVRVGLLRREPQRVLWVFRRIRYPAASDAAAQIRSEIRRRLLEAVDTAEAVDQRTAALCALVRAMGVERLAVPDRSRRVVRARFKEVAAVSWPAEAVRKAIAEAEAAVAAAATAATVSAASAGTASQ